MRSCQDPNYIVLFCSWKKSCRQCLEVDNLYVTVLLVGYASCESAPVVTTIHECHEAVMLTNLKDGTAFILYNQFFRLSRGMLRNIRSHVYELRQLLNTKVDCEIVHTYMQ